MDFGFSDEQQQIKATARDLLGERSPFPRVRAAAEARVDDAELWAELRALGWPGIAVAEEHGGQGLGAVELAILLEELGYAVAATPFLGTALAALALQRGGSDAQRARWLPGLASGELTGGFGRPGLAADADGAAVIVLLDDAGAHASSTAPTRTSRRLETIDPTRRYARVAGEGPALGGDVARRSAGALAAELVGVAQRALDMTVAYVKERRQFGVPVGAFQAVSHRCAEMLLQTESRAQRRLLRGLGGGRGARPAGRGRRHRDRGGRGGGARRHRLGDPGARRDRLHLGGRRPLAVQARPGRRGAAGRRERRPDRPRRAPAPRTRTAARRPRGR